MLTDDRMTKLLLKQREDATEGADPTFGYEGLIVSISVTEQVSKDEASRLLKAWLAGRGEITLDSRPCVIVREDAWHELIAEHG